MEELINSNFGLNVKVKEIEKVNNLPIYMTIGRKFHSAKDGNIDFIIISIEKESKVNITVLKKQYKQYEEKFNLPIVLYFDNIYKSQRDALIQNRISFIANNKQLYMPFLGMLIQNNTKQKIHKNKMMPITQSLFLYILYYCKDKPVTKSQAAQFLHVTNTSITRASSQLEAMNLISQIRDGKEYYMVAKETGIKYFKIAESYLINPVQEIRVVKNKNCINKLVYTNITALSKMSMLEDNNIKTYAVYKGHYNNLNCEEIDELWSLCKDKSKIELWKYDPNLFSKNNIADPISLYMSLKNSYDERIEESLNEIMENYQW